MKFKLFGKLKKKKGSGDRLPPLPSGGPSESSRGVGGGAGYGVSERSRGHIPEQAPRMEVGAPREVPSEEVRSMVKKGYSQSDITRDLRDKGYTYSQINKAMNSIIKNETVREEPSYPEPGPGTANDTEPVPLTSYSGVEEGPSHISVDADRDVERIKEAVPEEVEELIEVIVAEKMIDVDDEFDKFNKRFEDLDKKFTELKAVVDELKVRKDEDEKKFLEKMDEMENYLETSQSRIGGLEKALQQVLPSLVENVRDLARLVKDIKKSS